MKTPFCFIYHLALYKRGDFSMMGLNTFQPAVNLLFHFFLFLSCQNISDILLRSGALPLSLIGAMPQKVITEVLLITFTTIRHMKHNRVTADFYLISPLVRRFVVGQLVLTQFAHVSMWTAETY